MKNKNFDFDTQINRVKTHSTKWNNGKAFIPLTIADMDYLTCEDIKSDLLARINLGVFGYTDVDSSFYSSYQSFFKDNFNLNIKKESLVFSLGVVPTISSSVRALTDVGDNVCLTPPVYNIFYNSIINNHRVPLEVEMINDDLNYTINFDELEKAFADPKTKLFILCNPHNPIGKIYTIDELNRIGILAKKHNVIVLSDEIHGLITRPNIKYNPFVNANSFNSDISLTCLSPTKAFNLAGIHTSAIVIDNEEIRKKVVRQINTDEVAEPNILSIIASTSAFTKGRQYLKELNKNIFENKKIACDLINSIEGLKVKNTDATYLLWVDIRNITNDSNEFVSFLKENQKLLVQSGDIYGLGGKGFIRINVATQKDILLDGLNKLKKGVLNYTLKK